MLLTVTSVPPFPPLVPPDCEAHPSGVSEIEKPYPDDIDRSIITAENNERFIYNSLQ
jgi:hypothetical protein